MNQILSLKIETQKCVCVFSSMHLTKVTCQINLDFFSESNVTNKITCNTNTYEHTLFKYIYIYLYVYIYIQNNNDDQ